MEDFFAGVVDRWPPGQEDYHWHALPGPAAVRECLSGQYRELTHRPGLAPVARPVDAHHRAALRAGHRDRRG